MPSVFTVDTLQFLNILAFPSRWHQSPFYIILSARRFKFFYNIEIKSCTRNTCMHASAILRFSLTEELNNFCFTCHSDNQNNRHCVSAGGLRCLNSSATKSLWFTFNPLAGTTTLICTLITPALVSYLRSSVARALHRHRKRRRFDSCRRTYSW